MDKDKKGNPTDSMLSSIEEAASDAYLATDLDTAKNTPRWLRWLKYISLIVVPAIVFGFGFLFYDYIEQYRGDTFSQRARARRNIEGDSVDSMKFRFWVGASIGGGLGLIYVVHCIGRRADP